MNEFRTAEQLGRDEYHEKHEPICREAERIALRLKDSAYSASPQLAVDLIRDVTTFVENLNKFRVWSSKRSILSALP